MKKPLFVFFVAALLFSPWSAMAAKAPKLETLVGEYQKARTDVLAKLDDAYAAQAEGLAEQFQATANLEGLEHARQLAKKLRSRQTVADIVDLDGRDSGNDPVIALQLNYVRARAENLQNVYLFYATTAASLRQQLLRTKDQAGAKVVAEFLEKIKPQGIAAGPAGSGMKSGGVAKK